MISTTLFAQKMDVNYRTALNWLRRGLVPGAVERTMPGPVKSTFWEIPLSALEMERPKPGRKAGSKAAGKEQLGKKARHRGE